MSAPPARPYPFPHGFVVELTTRCDHACGHCYNAWKNPGQRAVEPLDTGGLLAVLDRLLEESGCELLTLTGGEPTLRPDLPTIVEHLHRRGVKLNLISHGGHIHDGLIQRLGREAVTTWELPLLAARPALHDKLSGRDGAFHRVTAAIAALKHARQRVVAVFVAQRPNLDQLEGVVELCVALGVDGLMINRFNPGGQGGRHIDTLQASPTALQAMLDQAEALSARWSLPMACSIAMPPCLIDTSRYTRIGFGYCALGTERAYYTVDPAGGLRPCNHSPTVLGDLRTESLRDILDGPALAAYVQARPEACRGCPLEHRCQGGCKAAAEACTGSPWNPDPFLGTFMGERRPLTPAPSPQGRGEKRTLSLPSPPGGEGAP
jgi:radical SAM protein with 4Fe4S-binding SPASM domain